MANRTGGKIVGELSLKEFLELPEEEKAEKFKLMSNHDKFIYRTNYEPLSLTVIGEEEVKTTPEEIEQNRKIIREYILKKTKKRA